MRWPLTWLAALRAWLGQGKSLEVDMTHLLFNLIYESLLNIRPAARFQIDSNFGDCAAPTRWQLMLGGHTITRSSHPNFIARVAYILG